MNKFLEIVTAVELIVLRLGALTLLLALWEFIRHTFGREDGFRPKPYPLKQRHFFVLDLALACRRN